METQTIITVPEGQIRDYIDGNFRKDTPEEYIRQNIEKRLIMEHKYPKNLIRVEFPIKHGSSTKKVDLAIFPIGCEDFSQQNIEIIIECKKETVPLNDKKDGIGQLQSYMSSCANCEWGMWTNGKEKEVFRKIKDEKSRIIFADFIDIPSYGKGIEEIDRPKRDNQRKAVEDNLLFAFKKCHNIIYSNEGMQKQPAFFELLKIIFCKIYDEKNILDDIEFYVTSDERVHLDGQLTLKKRIEKIFNKVKDEYPTIFQIQDKVELNPRTLANVVGELQNYSLLETNIDVKGKAYEEIVGANLRGDRGEFFTPRNVMKMAVKMLNPTVSERVLDSSCGTGGFLVNAMNHVIEQVETKSEIQFGRPKEKWTNTQREKVRNQISFIASKNFFGFDINPDLVKATKMNMVMNNDGSGNILRENSLLPPHEWSSEFKKTLAKVFKIDETDLTNEKKIELFDVILTNPPFGSKIPITDPNILKQFQLAKGSVSVPPEQLFIERCIQFLKPGGRLAIILPDSILGSPGLVDIRRWLLKYTKIIASIDLHVDTFQPRNGTQTSVLIVQKKYPDEINLPAYIYNVFMVMVEKIGHDKRGNNIYKRNKEGKIIYFKKIRTLENGEIEEFEETELDDQTILVPEVFTSWKKEEGIEW